MPNRRIQQSVAVMLIVLMTLMAACGGSGSESSTEAPQTTDAPATATGETTDPQPVAPTDTPDAIPTEAPTETTAEPAETSEPATEMSESASPTEPEATEPPASPTPLGPTPTIPPVPTRLPPPPPTTMTGNGTSTTSTVAFPVGIAVVTMNHNGAGRFRVRLQTEDMQVDRLIGEGTGTWKGSFGVMLHDAGDYLFSVVADGDWQVDVMWPTPETAPVSEAPFSYSGTGDQAVYFVLVQTGQHTLTLMHDGQGPFSVQTLTSEGRRYIDRFSGTGTGTASIDFMIRDKAFEFLLLNVRAAGNWTLEVQ